MTGTVAQIWRHPIKSHGRETLDEVNLIAGQTMPGDRVWAVAHEASKADGSIWMACANFSIGSKAPGLQAIACVYDEATGTVTLSHPDRPDLSLNPDQQPERLIDWVRPLMPADRAQSTRVVRVPGRGMTDTDYPSISIVNLASHGEVAKHLGQDITQHRWRGNVVLDALEPWQEFDWIGKTLRLGSSVVTVRERIRRCNATKANTDTGRHDADTLGALRSGWGHQDFGVYAEVLETGKVAVGGRVQVI